MQFQRHSNMTIGSMRTGGPAGVPADPGPAGAAVGLPCDVGGRGKQGCDAMLANEGRLLVDQDPCVEGGLNADPRGHLGAAACR